MQFLKHLPPSLQPPLEALLLDSQLRHPLAKTSGARWAKSAAFDFVVDAANGCAEELCRAVERKELACLDLTPTIDYLRASIIRYAYGAARIAYWEQFERSTPSTGSDAFKDEARARLEKSDRWGKVLKSRIELARSAKPATADDANRLAIAESPFERVMREARETLERSQAVAARLRLPERIASTKPAVQSGDNAPIAPLQPVAPQRALPDVAGSAAPVEEGMVTTLSATALRRFSNRARFVELYMERHAITTTNWFETHQGPSAQTMRRILEGKPVQNAVLNKLAFVMSRPGALVSRDDIPND